VAPLVLVTFRVKGLRPQRTVYVKHSRGVGRVEKRRFIGKLRNFRVCGIAFCMSACLK